MRLDELAAPGHTAVVTQECQGAVVGPDAGLRALAEEARRQAVPNIALLLPAAGEQGSARQRHPGVPRPARRRDRVGAAGGR
ncbi:MAG TPA: hypothetical protein PLI79_04925, partial [Mycobacterium sp.]|nr:hypothetical protein [Mycobacterium sp.]